MAARAFTLLSLALAITASPIQQGARLSADVVIGTPASLLVRRQDNASADAPAEAPVAAPKKTTKKGKKKMSKPKAAPKPVEAEEAPADEPAASPKTASPKNGGSSFLSGLGKSGGTTSGAPSASGASALSSIPFASSLTSMGMMSSNDITKGSYTCKKAALLFARGTGEPGNMGFVVGPPLGTMLRKKYGADILIQGIDYSTTFTGGGATAMVKISKELFTKCPETKIILGGYSQGAMQVHQALGSLGPDAGKIAIAVTFGDPYSTMGWGTGGIVGATMGLGGGLASLKGGASAATPAGKEGAASANSASFNPENGLILCATGDFVCGVVPNIGGGIKGAGAQTVKGGGSHIAYSSDGSIAIAADFIEKKLGGA